jgi:hypothetical protein
MIAQTLNNLVNEVSSLWAWGIGIVAGWGLTLTLVIVAIVYAHVRITRLRKEVEAYRNYQVTDTRELSMRLRKLEK